MAHVPTYKHEKREKRRHSLHPLKSFHFLPYDHILFTFGALGKFLRLRRVCFLGFRAPFLSASSASISVEIFRF
ncbi:hypothetical protein L1887_31987 [Cichorium endivia]|nr:hypothetical protein L1887_31987 [Cichorium endivia]